MDGRKDSMLGLVPKLHLEIRVTKRHKSLKAPADESCQMRLGACKLPFCVIIVETTSSYLVLAMCDPFPHMSPMR